MHSVTMHDDTCLTWLVVSPACPYSWGEPFNLGRHEQGTEIKAITYSAMQVCLYQ
jgi:hypothetical protein